MGKLNRKKLVEYLLILIVSCSAFFIGKSLMSFKESNDYKNSVINFERVTVDQVENLQSENKSFVLYTGRKTCPHCRIFVPKLKIASEQSEMKIYYLDSEDYKTNQKLINFRNKYEILSVPSLINFNGKLKVSELDIDDEIKVETIQQFLIQE